jgi:hypothetical protein
MPVMAGTGNDSTLRMNIYADPCAIRQNSIHLFGRLGKHGDDPS